MRNPARGEGYGVQLPIKVGNSNTFYPDFLWWVNGECFAIDPTGPHILHDKVCGALLSVDAPKIVLFAKGRVSSDWSTISDTDGYTIVLSRANRSPAPEYVNVLHDALQRLLGAKKA